MVTLNDYQLDIALRYAVLYCCKDDIEYIDSLRREDITVSPKTERKVMRQWDREQHEPLFRVPKYLKTAAVAILLSISILFGVAMCIEPVRAAFIEAVVTWYEDYFLVSFQKSQVETEFVPMEPTYIPEGFELTEHYETDKYLFYKYYDKNENYIAYEQYKNNLDVNFYNDITEFKLSNCSMKNKNNASIVCYVSDNCRVISNKLEIDELSMSFVETLEYLGISGATNTLSALYSLSKDVRKKTGGKKSGVYTYLQSNAFALSVVLGNLDPPLVHGSGYYAHYHDGLHLIHIWFGYPIY